jgi:hypothetical protein
VTARIEHLVTSGTFSLDGETFDVDNNVWLLGDDDEVMVFDAPHDPDAIEAAVGDRTVVAIACTHAHDDHVRCAPELAERLSTSVLLHPDDRVLWDLTHARHEPDGNLRDGQTLEVAGTKVKVLHTPATLPARSASPCRTSGGAVRRHAVLGRTRARRAQLQRLPDDPGLDPHPAAHAAAGDPRAHRARRRDDRRRRGPVVRRVGQEIGT